MRLGSNADLDCFGVLPLVVRLHLVQGRRWCGPYYPIAPHPSSEFSFNSFIAESI